LIERQKIIDIYTNCDIEHWTEGKNVTTNWVNVTCPFCDDHSNHCGVNPATSIFSCWLCGAKGGFIDLLMKLTGQSFTVCKEMVEDSAVSFKVRPLDRITNIFQGEIAVESDEVEKEVHCVLPERFELITEDTWSPLLDTYQKRRNILRSTIIDSGCGICRSGRYMNRMVIPVVCGGKLVAYQAADMSGTSNLKYQSSPLSMGNINDYLYGYDAIDRRMIVVEGILDKWRVGIEAVAAFTSSISQKQIKLILAKGLDELYFCFDPELRAINKARKVAKEFEAYIPKVGVLRLPTKIQTSTYHNEDPNDVGREKIYQLIEELDL